jgi:siderophore synthetase component
VPEDAAAQATLPEARAAVLSRLWGALVREPVPGLSVRDRVGDDVIVKLPDGRGLRGDHAAGQLFASVRSGFAIDLDGVPFDDPGRLVRALDLPGPAAAFAAELDGSVANLALARAVQPTPDGGPGLLARAAAAPDPLVHLEQSVVDGHPIHPCCRTRRGLSRQEVIDYAPEHRPLVPLAVYAVPPSHWIGVNAAPRLVVHPWQRDHVLDRYPWLRDIGERIRARPLMSLRTLALVDDATQHIKTAVDVQMTSAVRVVSPAAVHNGPVVSRLIASLGLPGLTVLPEVASGAVIVDGEPCSSLAMLRRRMVGLDGGELAMPAAALAAPSPADGRPLLVECIGTGDPVEYVRRLAAVILAPLLTLLRLGIALEAHGQNLLLVVRHGKPVRMLYRDLGGVRLSPARLSRHGLGVPELRGDLATDDPVNLRTKLFAAAVTTVLGEVVTLLGRWYGVEPETAWRQVAAVVREQPETSDTVTLLRDPLPVKAMTAMRLAADPLVDQWTWLPNPMGG